MPTVYLSIGSNLGDRRQHFRDALAALDPVIEEGSLRVAGLYETEPVDCPPGSPSFLNSVIEFATDLAPEALLEVTRAIETALGRPRERGKNTPRPVDLDLLLYGAETVVTPDLTVPHPRMMERAFVLLPLAELRPDFLAASRSTDGSGVRRLDEPLISPEGAW